MKDEDQSESDCERVIAMEEKVFSTTALLTNKRPIIINKPEDKFETMLFLPENNERKGEGGLRTKGYFKHSYVKRERSDVKCKTLNEERNTSGADTNTNTADFASPISHLTSNKNDWWITDFDNNSIQPAPSEIQQKINDYFTSNTSHLTSNTLHLTPDIPNSLPLISIITVVYNGEKYLEETIQSVINQTYPNVEYIIIDGGSIDGTLDIIKKYEHVIDYWVSEPDEGISDAFNKGLVLSSGNLIGLLNSDDYYVDHILKKVLDFSINDEFQSIIYGDINRIINEKYYFTSKGKKNVDFSCYMNGIFHPSSFVPKYIYKRIGLYSRDYKYAMDYDFFSRAQNYNFSFKYINEIITNMRLGGLTAKFELEVLKEVKEISKFYPNKKCLLYYLKRYIKLYVKRILFILSLDRLIFINRKIKSLPEE